MQIAYVYDAVLPWETGGVQRRVWELAKRLADDHDVSWYGLKYWDGPSTIEREGVTIHGIAPEQELYVDGRRSIREALSFSSRLLPSLLGADHDVIDCQEFPYFPVFASKASAMLHDTTLCVTWHEIWGDYWYDYLGRKGAVGKVVEYLCGRLADEQIAVSERTRRDLEGIGVEGARLVPNGIDAAAIQSVPAADDDVDVVFAARLIKEKNPGLLVRAVERLAETRPGIRCRIVGEGPERARVERLVEQCSVSDNVRVTGFLDDRDDLLGLLKVADVYALPSRREGFGITALEALACGTPVATIDHDQNAAADLVTDGETGVVTQPTVREFSEGLRRAARDIDPVACRREAESYDWDRITGEMESLYRATVGGA